MQLSTRLTMPILNFFFVFFFITVSTCLYAQNNGINYKALIKDNAGELVVNQTIAIRFSVLKGTAQTNVYQETHTTSTDENGFAIVNIGEGPIDSGSFTGIAWGTDDYFLNVQISIGAGLVDMGTTQFKSVPYALEAANVTGFEALDEGNGIGWRLIGKSASNYGNIGVNAVDLSHSTVTSTTIGARGSRSFAVGENVRASGVLSAAFGYENEATGFTSTALGYRTRANSVGNVTVGTYNIGGGNPGNFNPLNPVFEVGNGTSSGARSNALTVLQNGNVGIGKHTDIDGMLEIEGNSTTSSPQLALIENNTGFARIKFKNTNRNGDDFWDLAGIIGTTPADDRLNFFNSDGGNIISITGDAKVGINTSNPAEELDVNGRIKAEEIQLTLGAASGFVLTSDASGNASWQAPTGGGGGGVPDNDWIVTGSSMYAANPFKVGIGTSNPTEDLEVGGKIKAEEIQLTTGWALGHVLTSDSFGSASWQPVANSGWTASSDQTYFNLSGNVGIGTNTPLEKLHVVGKIRTSEFQLDTGGTPGYILTAGPGGNATWEEGAFGWTITGQDDMYANATGNVGIGTNNPSSKLTVEGDMRVTEGIFSISNSSPQSSGVHGSSTIGTGVRGTSGVIGVLGIGDVIGGQFTTNTGTGLIATTQAAGKSGIEGTSNGNTGVGVFGRANATTGSGVGVVGYSDGATGTGVNGTSFSVDGTGVKGVANSGNGIGVEGLGASIGVNGFSTFTNGTGVSGFANGSNGIGVKGSGAANGYDFYADGAGVDYGAASSRRWKSNIVEIDNPLEKLAQIRGVYYDWDEAHGGGRDVGMIAEEVGTVLPEIVQYEVNGVDAIGMDYSKMSPLLVEIAKAQLLRIESLEEEVQNLSKENKEIKAIASKVAEENNQIKALIARVSALETDNHSSERGDEINPEASGHEEK